jgi:hypothetical protein
VAKAEVQLFASVAVRLARAVQDQLAVQGSSAFLAAAYDPDCHGPRKRAVGQCPVGNGEGRAGARVGGRFEIVEVRAGEGDAADLGGQGGAVALDADRLRAAGFGVGARPARAMGRR